MLRTYLFDPLGALASVAGALGTLWIFALMFLINADVIGRHFFNAPIPGIPEIVSQSIVGIVFLQLSDALRRGRLIRSDVLLGRLLNGRGVAGLLLLAVHNVVGAGLMGLIACFSFPRLRTAWENDEYVGNFGSFMMPIWPFVAIIVFTTILACVYYIYYAVCPQRMVESERREAHHG